MGIHSFTHLFLLSLFCLSSATEFSYSDHCSLIVPQSTSTQSDANLTFPLGQFHTGYGGGTRIFNQTSFTFSKSFVFRTRTSYYTNTPGVLKVEADFIFPAPYISNHDTNLNQGMGKSLIRLSLNGFWSESSGKLCMIGSTTISPDFKALLKLDNIRNSTNVSSLISGTLECLNSSNGFSCFQPISILMLPQMNYEYSLVPQQFDSLKNSSFFASSMAGLSFCNEAWWPPNGFNLKYEAKSCVISENSCSPFGDKTPSSLFITGFGCSDKGPKFRVLLEFSKISSTDFYIPFYPNSTLVGEGFWDENKLSIVACRFLNIAAESSASARVDDCSIRLSLTFSDTLSIRETGNVVGKIWTNKTAKDPGYFNSIMFYSSENRIVDVPGLQYNYTQTERVNNLCTQTQSIEQNRARYPNRNSSSMRFDMFSSSSGGKIGSGYAIPLFIDDPFYANSAVEDMVNMSYNVGLTMLPRGPEVEISAEGIYNKKSGRLCMVGCRNHGLDCEILLKFQCSPWGNVKGRIESMREKTDPLYFDPMETSSSSDEHSNSMIEAKNLGLIMNMEMVISLISSTLSCTFIYFQCLHGKKQPQLIPLVSAVMLSILILGNLQALVENLGSLLLKNGDQKHQFRGLGIGETLELMVCLFKMVVLFFQFYLLQITWIGRSKDERSKIRLWNCERKSLVVCVAVYGGMGLFGVEFRIWREVVLNGFLLPQILVNFFREGNENAVSTFFYVGTTFIQLLPHFYNLCQVYAYPLWDIIVIVEGVVFAAMIYWQQSYGGGNFILIRG